MRNKPLLFVSMFSLVAMINVNFAILRSLRNTLAVADLGGSALHVPYFELCGTLPAAILMSWLLERFLRRFSIHTTFQASMSVFLTFFLLFALVVYPRIGAWEEVFPGISLGFSMSFYIMAELWKVALLTILFWGLVNQFMPLDDAKKIYAPLMLAGSAGFLVAGPIITLCSSGSEWAVTLRQLLTVVVLFGACTAILYAYVWRVLARGASPLEQEPPSRSVWTCMQSPYLLLLGGIVLADYVAYSLGEVIFLEALRQRYPQPQNYCLVLGHLSFWTGLLTCMVALVLAPKVLKKWRWEVAALVTPICVLATEGAFFLVLRLPEGSQSVLGWNAQQWLEVVVWLGSLQYCLCRAVKYTLFDSSRELAFLMLPTTDRLPGELLVDGVCARVGRGGAAFLSLFFAQLCGGILASAWLAGLVAFAVSAGWVAATRRLGGLVDAVQKYREV